MPEYVKDKDIEYVCTMHTDFSKEYIPGVGHYPRLPDDQHCKNCTPLALRCPRSLHRDDSSSRCMRRIGHGKAHLSDVLMPAGHTARQSWMKSRYLPRSTKRKIIELSVLALHTGYQVVSSALAARQIIFDTDLELDDEE